MTQAASCFCAALPGEELLAFPDWGKRNAIAASKLEELCSDT